MRGKKGEEWQNGVKGALRGWLDIYYLPLLKGDLPQENNISICMYISKYVFKFSVVSFFKTHLTDYFCVWLFNKDFCGVPKMLLLCCRLFFFFFLGQQTGCWGEASENPPWRSRCGKRSRSREGWGGQCPHHTHSHHRSSKFGHTSEKKPLPPPSCLS